MQYAHAKSISMIINKLKFRFESRLEPDTYSHNIILSGFYCINIMKLTLPSTVTGMATVLFSVVNADNTPNLCTPGIDDLIKIKPSDASGIVPPNITVGGFEYNGDAEHFVIGTTTSTHNN